MPKNVSAQSIKVSTPTVFDQLFEPIDNFIKEQGSTLTKHHNQKFEYYDFFRLLIYFFVSGEKSLKLFINTKLNLGLLSSALRFKSIPYSTFREAFERYPIALFQDVFRYLLSTVSFKRIPELAALGTLYCIDGSLFPVINSMLWAEYTNKHQSLKLHLCFELNRMIPVEFMVTAANYSERKAFLKMLKAGVTYIADRGYMSFKVVHEIVTAEAYFVFRVKENLKLSVVEKLKIQMPDSVKNTFKNVTDELILYTNDEFKHTNRLVRFSVGAEIFCILTNRRDLTTFQVIMLYAYRWQIELLFRFLKRTMNGIHLIRQDEKGVTIQFYVILIAALLEFRLKQITVDIDDNNRPFKNTVLSENVMIHLNEPQKAPISCGHVFIETIGKNLKKYWKIGVHWLTALKIILAQPFDRRTVDILNSS